MTATLVWTARASARFAVVVFMPQRDFSCNQNTLACDTAWRGGRQGRLNHKGTNDTKRNIKFCALGELCAFVV
jgi:hypothetical protein